MADEGQQGKQGGAADAGAGAGNADAGAGKGSAADVVSREEFNRVVAQRDTFKAQLREAEPLINEGKKAIDATKTAADKLAETEAALRAEREARSKERRETALRLAAAKAGVKNTDLVLRLADAGVLKEDDGGAILGAEEAIAAVLKDVPGLVDPTHPGRTPGPGGPGNAGVATMKAADFYALPLGGQFEAAEKRRKAGELAVVP